VTDQPPPYGFPEQPAQGPTQGPQGYGPAGGGPQGYGPPYVPPSGTPPLDFGEVLDRGFRLWWKTIRTTVPWLLAIVLPTQIVAVWVASRPGGFQEWSENFQKQSQQPGATPDFSGLNSALASMFPLLLLGLLTNLVAQGMLTAFYTDRILLRNTPIRDCMRSIVGRLLPLAGVALLSGLAGMLGLLMCCIGILFFMTRLAVASQVCIVERAGPSQSLKRSWDLTEKRFWPMLGLVIVTALIAQIVNLPFSTLGTALGNAIPGIGGNIVNVALTTVGSALATGLGAAFMVFAYLDLRVRFERLDLGVIAAQAGSPA
jgi:hypothetical protein